MSPAPAGQRARARQQAGRRADAQRSIAAILEAALACLTRDLNASIADIARVAGVGRVTLYGHFSSRADLVEAVFARALAQADDQLAQVDTTGDTTQALTRLVASSWRIVAQLRRLLVAAEREMPPERIRDHHDRTLRRVRQLVERGQHDGTFRTDLPADWLVATFYSTLHTAADEITAGRLGEGDADHTLTATLLGAFRPLVSPVDQPRSTGRQARARAPGRAERSDPP